MKGVLVCGRGAELQFTQLKPVYLALERPYLHPNPAVIHGQSSRTPDSHVCTRDCFPKLYLTQAEPIYPFSEETGNAIKKFPLHCAPF